MAAEEPFVRRVVTTEEPHGIASDGAPPRTFAVRGGFGVSEVWWSGERPDEGFPLEPPPGGWSSRVIRMPGGGDWLRVEGDDDGRPGMHATDTLDLMVVLDGEIVLGLADGTEHVVRAGDAVVQRGTQHRWRVAAAEPCTYWVTMLRHQAPVAGGSALEVRSGDSGVRRFVTGGDGVEVGEGPVGLSVGSTRIVDLWQTGGPVGSVTQGGDPPAGPWALEPLGGGVSLRIVELAPGVAHGDAGWHRTATEDVDVILSGRLRLELPGGVSTVLEPGDVVVQLGTDHRWTPVGDEPARMASVMVATHG
jgi:quercetin dioxygenase-like cupin family protein